MFNQEKFHKYLADYKRDFTITQWPNEKYKWEAVKHFQRNWNIEADDLAGMLKDALAKTGNLLGSKAFFPAGVLQAFAELEPETLRQMFRDLFDETQDVVDRILAFKRQSTELLERHQNDRNWKTPNTFQTENSITTYLWLRYPDKYFIYKFDEARKLARKIDATITFTKGHYIENLRGFLKLYNGVRAELEKDAELRSMLALLIDENCYPDTKLCTMTIDFAFYVSRMISIKGPNDQTSYGDEEFLEEVYVSEESLHELKTLMLRKKNLILQGAPGVGKTYIAKRLAYTLIGDRDDSQIKLIQFHQNYTYEDFIKGYRLNLNGSFDKQLGVFYEFCEKAKADGKNKYFLIIDEINRGDVSKIFGELLTVIENNYRGTSVDLANGQKDFIVPENLYIIGMMGAANQNPAVLDYGLRRRFSFFELKPAFWVDVKGKLTGNPAFIEKMESYNEPKVFSVLTIVAQLNKAIAEESSLGKGCLIGHSYFCFDDLDDDEEEDKGTIPERLEQVVKYDLIPTLEEYWRDNGAELAKWQEKLYAAAGVTAK